MLCVSTGDGEDEEIDGWDVIQRPLAWAAASLQGPSDALPPRPSETEDAIGQWERAMIIDSSSNSMRLAHRLLLGQIAPLGQGAFAAADRLWQGFKRTS